MKVLKWHKVHSRATDGCFLDLCIGKDENTTVVYLEVGQDMHMNGMDSPARLNGPEDIRRLIVTLEQIAKNWPT